MYFTRRNLLQGLLSISLTSCLGSFEVVRLHDAPRYETYHSSEDIPKINFAHLNAADLRGNTPNIFQFISEEEARDHARWLADFFLEHKIDAINFNEVDYAGTIKTGGLDQPKVIAEFMGKPYDYVIFDQYMKSPLWTTGNAMISRFPIKALHRHLYGETGDILDNRLDHFFKDFIHVELKVGDRKLQVFYTHLDDGEEEYEFRKRAEVKELITHLREFVEKEPRSYIVVAGDFNFSRSSRLMKNLLADGILHPPATNFGLKTYPSDAPAEDLDHILASHNIAINNYRTFHFPWSDHLGLLCELEFLD